MRSVKLERELLSHISLRKAFDSSDTNRSETFSRIVFSFQVQKFFEVRIACDDLPWFRKF